MVCRHGQHCASYFAALPSPILPFLKPASPASPSPPVQFPYEPLKFLPKSLRLTFAEGIQMLQEAGYDVSRAALVLCCALLPGCNGCLPAAAAATAAAFCLPHGCMRVLPCRAVPSTLSYSLACSHYCAPAPRLPAFMLPAGGSLWRPQHRAGARAGQAGQGEVQHG